VRNDEETTLTPDRLLDAFFGQAGINWKALCLPSRAALAFQSGGLESLRALSKAEPIGSWVFPISNQPLFVGEYHGEEVLVAKMPVSAPNAVAYAECLILLGVDQMIVTGAAGSIHPEAPAYALVATTSAVREEGTSYHYLSASTIVQSSDMLLARLQQAAEKRSVPLRRGPTWSTDGVFRQTQAKVAHYRSMGILTVEMELAGLFAMAMKRGIELAGLLVVSDTHYDEPQIVSFSEQYQQSQHVGAEIILDALCQAEG